MNLQDPANVGELVGGIAVIASLVYLAIRIHQNARSLRARTFQAVATLDLGALFVVVGALQRDVPCPASGRSPLDIDGGALFERACPPCRGSFDGSA